MSKFCQNCGNSLDDNAAFCDKCGKPFEAPQAPQAPEAPQYAAPQYTAPQYDAPQYDAPQYGAAAVAVKKNPFETALEFVKAKKMIFIAGAVGLVVLILLIVIISSCASNSPEGALNKLFNSAKNLDLRGAADVNYEVNFDKDIDKEKEIKEQEEKIKAAGEMAKLYKEALKNMKSEIKENKKLSDDEMKELVNQWSERYKDTDKISEIHEIKYSVSGTMGMNGTGTCYAVKVGGKWYIKGMGTNLMG